MHDVISILQNRMADLGLSYVDEDFGQLEAIDTETDTYPLTFPAVLINTQNTSWDGLGGKEQTGNATLSVKLIIDCYDDTHAYSTTTDRILERSSLNHELTKALHTAKICDGKAMLTRVSSNAYNSAHLLKVYETFYSAQIIESFADEDAKAKPAIKIRAGLYMPGWPRR